MAYQPLADGELIYEAKILFTEEVDYGLSMADLTSGKVSIPLAGARFDQTFQGILHGPKVRGKITGMDYLTVRADGLFQLHLHGRITTEEGENISLASEGVSMQVEGEIETQLRSAVRLYTLSESYLWLNRLQLWSIGSLDPSKGEAFIRAFSV
jgi:hypothetical protein